MDLPAHIRSWWSQYRVTALRMAIAVLAVVVVAKLESEFFRLLFDGSQIGAIDLRFRFDEVQRWFAHLPVYSESEFATYPPMSYSIFWLALGWAPLSVCRWLWAAASMLSLCWLAWMTVQESGASTRLERIFAALLPLSINATGVAIGNGQLVLFLVPMLWMAILLVVRKPELGWRSELAVVTLVLVSLVQPTTASPFFWIVLIAARRIRPAMLVVLGYIVLSLLAASFQADDLPTLVQAWIDRVQDRNAGRGYADLHLALFYLGLGDWMLPASGLVIAGLGVWTYVHRRLDPWLLLGVTAIVARLWTYHGLYDDLLIIFPMVALFRIAKGTLESNNDIKAAILLGSAVLVMLIPARVYFFWEPPWPALYAWVHVAVWLSTLAFLVMQASSWRAEPSGSCG